jgi:pyruvate formate lyase activating enzyme
LEEEMREALLYDRLDGEEVQCRLCPWNCQIAPGELGRCRVRQNQEGTLHSLNYGLISAAAVDPVERRGVYHLFPGSLILCLGGWGSSLHCRHRPVVPDIPEEQARRRFLDPERATNFALEHRCRGVAWTFEEPVVWLEYVLDSAKLAKANGFYTLIKTNGYINNEALDLLGPYMNAYIVEILSASTGPYETLCDLAQWQDILDATVYAQERWSCHIEVHTPIILGINREDSIIRELAGWIRDHLGEATPWHVWRYETAGELVGQAPSSHEDLEWAQQVGQESGLQYVYIQGDEEVGLTSTHCPSCGQVLVQRQGDYYVKVVGMENGKCGRCGLPIQLKRSIFK